MLLHYLLCLGVFIWMRTFKNVFLQLCKNYSLVIHSHHSRITTLLSTIFSNWSTNTCVIIEFRVKSLNDSSLSYFPIMQNVIVDPFSKPWWPISVQQVCVCVCCQYIFLSLGGQLVYCSTLLHFTLFFHWDWRSFTQEILIDLSAHKSLVCVFLCTCVCEFICADCQVLSCVKEVKDQIFLSISVLDNNKPLSNTHSKERSSFINTLSHKCVVSITCYLVTSHLFNNFISLNDPI